MSCRIAELRHKEVINQSDGMRLGFVDDVEIDTKNACLISIIIYGRPKLFGILGRHDDLVIPWGSICLIGEDTILVKCPGRPRKPKKRRIIC
ncbi:MAG: YlmC/YmxH family sporulation protein [Clostridia bacterium]|nr:YlmC/YmxH family sporulation protein [Clostridia bacterium]MBQ2152778.1 YlmC/YmxH family sporulation protein [Clostridia bacterium]MBQ5439186.1 YlmC/YmxH family sporulation protein [Clostridia bacterium]